MRKDKKNTVAKISFDVVRFAENGVPPKLFTTPEVAALLRLSVSILNKWRLAGRGPNFVRVGSRVRYRSADVVEYVTAQTRASTSQQKRLTADERRALAQSTEVIVTKEKAAASR
jgi:hypothetical protein